MRTQVGAKLVEPLVARGTHPSVQGASSLAPVSAKSAMLRVTSVKPEQAHQVLLKKRASSGRGQTRWWGQANRMAPSFLRHFQIKVRRRRLELNAVSARHFLPVHEVEQRDFLLAPTQFVVVLDFQQCKGRPSRSVINTGPFSARRLAWPTSRAKSRLATVGIDTRPSLRSMNAFVYDKIDGKASVGICLKNVSAHRLYSNRFEEFALGDAGATSASQPGPYLAIHRLA